MTAQQQFFCLFECIENPVMKRQLVASPARKIKIPLDCRFAAVGVFLLKGIYICNYVFLFQITVFNNNLLHNHVAITYNIIIKIAFEVVVCIIHLITVKPLVLYGVRGMCFTF